MIDAILLGHKSSTITGMNGRKILFEASFAVQFTYKATLHHQKSFLFTGFFSVWCSIQHQTYSPDKVAMAVMDIQFKFTTNPHTLKAHLLWFVWQFT